MPHIYHIRKLYHLESPTDNLDSAIVPQISPEAIQPNENQSVPAPAIYTDPDDIEAPIDAAPLPDIQLILQDADNNSDVPPVIQPVCV